MGGPLTSLRELPLSRATQPLNVEGYRQVRSTFVQPDLIGKSTVWVTSHRIASPSIPILIPIPYNTYIPLRCPSTPPSRSPRSHLTSPRLPHSPLLLTALYKHCSSPLLLLLPRFRCRHQHTSQQTKTATCRELHLPSPSSPTRCEVSAPVRT